MSFKRGFLQIILSTLIALSVKAQTPEEPESLPASETTNILEELNPFDPRSEEILEQYDRIYQKETGLSAHINGNPFSEIFKFGPSCFRSECLLWVQVVKSEQKLYLFLNGQVEKAWPVSTGAKGWTTPNFDTHPNGRIYDAYSSNTFPGGDYQGLGNMPFAVFIQGGFAIHGTPKGSWARLGSPASHGCIRLHPDNALYFNRLVRQLGVDQVWITVQD